MAARIFVQFENGVQVGGQSRYAIGTTDALSINLEECSGCGVSGWGWRDERWGDTRTAAPVLLRFPPGGWTRVRLLSTSHERDETRPHRIRNSSYVSDVCKL